MIVLVRLLVIAFVLARLRDGLAALRWCRQREMLGVEVTDDALQPNVEERREIRVVDAAVVRGVRNNSVEGFIVVEQFLGVTSRYDCYVCDLGEFTNAVRFSFQREMEDILLYVQGS